jgi:hypothetical protein
MNLSSRYWCGRQLNRVSALLFGVGVSGLIPSAILLLVSAMTLDLWWHWLSLVVLFSSIASYTGGFVCYLVSEVLEE